MKALKRGWGRFLWLGVLCDVACPYGTPPEPCDLFAWKNQSVEFAAQPGPEMWYQDCMNPSWGNDLSYRAPSVNGTFDCMLVLPRSDLSDALTVSLSIDHTFQFGEMQDGGALLGSSRGYIGLIDTSDSKIGDPRWYASVTDRSVRNVETLKVTISVDGTTNLATRAVAFRIRKPLDSANMPEELSWTLQKICLTTESKLSSVVIQDFASSHSSR